MDQEVTLEDAFGSLALDTPLPGQPSLLMQNARLRLILEVSRTLNATLDLGALLSLVIRLATEVTGTQAASISLLDEKTGELRLAACTHTNPAELRAAPVRLDGSTAGWIVRNHQSLMLNDTRVDAHHCAQVAGQGQFDVCSILGVPLAVTGRTIGVLEVLNKCDKLPFSGADMETLETLAVQAAVAIENARLHTDLQAQMRNLQETQARLVQSEKLAAMGELVAGVAHELNNPLTSIIGLAHLLQRGNLDDQGQKDLDTILLQARRAAGIVRGLLEFARQHPPQHRPTHINATLEATLKLLGYELRANNIEHSINLCPDLPHTMADPHQLQQVFVNLVNNAWQAMSKAHGGGHLSISTEWGPPTCGGQGTEAQPAIRVIIQDDGPGIPAHLLSSIFDPFFTTKPEGQGTGLGLSICHGIVSQHGGHIWVESEPGRGAAFFVELPLVAPETLPRTGNGTQKHG